MAMADNRNPIPTDKLPQHIAIIMDGNGRWAKKRGLPRFLGHRAGVEAVRNVVRVCINRGIRVLTLFAFSSENWQRPAKEVGLLMELFVSTLDKEVKRLHKNNVRLRIIGDRSAFGEGLQQRIRDAEELTRNNTGMTLVIAANYGGRWDIAQAAQQLAEQVRAGVLLPSDITPELLNRHIALADLPEPDLLIRSSGEQRISNFLIWQLAYTELYFTETLWPDFDEKALDDALLSFANRQRRFGQTAEQLEQELIEC
ncbi:MAG: isoprenyl transferase [Pseudomonadota bacterium]